MNEFSDVMVSVVIPIYNAQKYIQKCLLSLQCQSFKSIEIICIDDGSVDKSKEIVRQFMKNDERIRLLENEQNRGQAYARNRGIEEAVGKYIYFMDADDELASDDAFEILYSVAEKECLDCVLFDAVCISEDITKECPMESDGLKMKNEYPSIYDGWTAFSLLISNGDFHPAVWQQFWRFRFIVENGIRFHERTSPHEDLLFTFQAMSLCTKLRHLPQVFYKYCYRENSSSNDRFNEKRFRAYCICYQNSVEFVRSRDIPAIAIDAVSLYLNYIKQWLVKGAHFLLKNGIDVSTFDWADPLMNIWVRTILRDGNIYVNHIFTPDEYQMLVTSDQVIVYGAGNLGKETVQMLERLDIKNYVVAITKKNPKETYLYGNEIRELSEFQSINNRSVVLIAANSNYQNEMQAKLTRMGFLHYINMCC